MVGDFLNSLLVVALVVAVGVAAAARAIVKGLPDSPVLVVASLAAAIARTMADH